MARLSRVVLLFALGLAAASPAHARQPVTSRYDETFRKYAKRFFGPGYDWRLFKAQAMTESNLNPEARSQVGARGLMQLMPMTFKEVQTKNPEIQSIDHPEWNIAAGIFYDRQLWRQLSNHPEVLERKRFMFGSYNAGRATLRRAQDVAQGKALDPLLWPSIQTVAPEVPRWRYVETLQYVERIEQSLSRMDDDGQVVRRRASGP